MAPVIALEIIYAIIRVYSVEPEFRVNPYNNMKISIRTCVLPGGAYASISSHLVLVLGTNVECRLLCASWA